MIACNSHAGCIYLNIGTQKLGARSRVESQELIHTPSMLSTFDTPSSSERRWYRSRNPGHISHRNCTRAHPREILRHLRLRNRSQSPAAVSLYFEHELQVHCQFLSFVL